MKLVLLYLKGKPEPWAEEACEDLVKKISRFFQTERISIKSKSLDRDDAVKKKNAEGEALLENLSPSDFVILFDEHGKLAKSSEEFSSHLVKVFSQQRSRFVFVIGGPYGFSDEVLKRADLKLSLSPLTMNHHLAQVTALEQIYRALTIWKGLPYHNI
jgi:23S rRNA (pseudouridine1915-N3)-methyltransferase